MKLFTILSAVIGIVVLVGAVGYVGYRSASGDERTVQRTPATVAVSKGDVQQTVVAPGRAVGTHEVMLGMAVGGTLEEVLVRPGSVVKECDVLARVATEPLEEILEMARLDRERVLLHQFEEWVDPRLTQRVNRAEEDLAAASLTAPFDGIVLDVTAIPGEAVAPDTGFIVLADPTALEVRTTVIEEDLPLVEVGQPVELFFDASVESATSGRVTRIVPRRVPEENRPLYHVYIEVNGVPEGVVSGMTADASIVVDRRSDVLRLPRAVVRGSAGGTARISVWDGERAEQRTVTVGLRGDVNVEIVDGLREGERVVAE